MCTRVTRGVDSPTRARQTPPYRAYAAITGIFAGGLGAAGALARAFGRNPACQTPLDLVVLSAASFKGARTLAHDEVTSFLRDRFVRGRAHTGEGEEPVETGDWEQAIGELVTCSRCAGRGSRQASRRRRSSRHASDAC